MTAAINSTGSLADCEAVIERGLGTFVEVGNALLRIRDERLYRDGYRDFESYCQSRWSMGRRHVNRMIEAADVVDRLGPIGPAPANEAQARELVGLDAETAAAVMAKAVEDTDGKVTATAIREARGNLGGGPEQQEDDAPAGSGDPIADLGLENVGLRDTGDSTSEIYDLATGEKVLAIEWTDGDSALTDEECRDLADPTDVADDEDWQHLDEPQASGKTQRQQLTTLTNIANILGNYPEIVARITAIYPLVKPEEAARLTDRFSKGIRALSRINRLLKERASTQEES